MVYKNLNLHIMANLCSNKLYFSCEGDFEVLYDKLIKTISEHFTWYEDYKSVYDNVGSAEISFDSKWNFPREVLQYVFTEEEANTYGIYMRCLSEEYGMGYVAMNIYTLGAWAEEQCFNL